MNGIIMSCVHDWELVNFRELTCANNLSHRAWDRRKICKECKEMKYLSSICVDCPDKQPKHTEFAKRSGDDSRDESPLLQQQC